MTDKIYRFLKMKRRYYFNIKFIITIWISYHFIRLIINLKMLKNNLNLRFRMNNSLMKFKQLIISIQSYSIYTNSAHMFRCVSIYTRAWNISQAIKNSNELFIHQSINLLFIYAHSVFIFQCLSNELGIIKTTNRHDCAALKEVKYNSCWTEFEH